MPLVNIRLTRRDEPTTRAQKDALIAGVTRLLQDVLAKRPESVVVVIDEVDPDNWGEGGVSVRVLRERRRNAAGQA